MSTGKEVGKLYAYFLEAATPFIYTHVHLDMNIRDPGKGMYEDLVQKLGGGNPEKYTEKIKEHKHFTDMQRTYLIPPDGIIDKKKLDFTIYVQIYSLLGGSINWKPMKYMRETRNALCHRSLVLLRPDVTENDLEEEWELMKQHFERYMFTKAFIDKCENEIH